MRIVIEDYPYRQNDIVKALPGFSRIPKAKNGYVKLDYVGYCFLPEANDCVFFLPKVVLKENAKAKDESKDFNENDFFKDEDPEESDERIRPNDWVFGEFRPKDLLMNSKDLLNEEQSKFIHGLSIWVYRAISEFLRLNPNSSIISYESVSLVDNTRNEIDYTFIDTLISLVRFNEENQDFFMFIIKNIHSGYDRINWRKTISTKQPFIQDDSPVYMNPVNRKKQINFDEELLIIFFSILKYIHETYGFPVKLNFNYDLITGEEFERYIDFYGAIRLKQIKYKYFSDRALKLWHLCYAFFDRISQLHSSKNVQDCMLAYKFEKIFEAIIDELLGQKNLASIKKQKDGKIIDHIYRYYDLIHRREDNIDSEIYYIGDSKYYKIGASVGKPSIYKQYTYAKNIIQFDFDWGYDKQSEGEVYDWMYLDELTEGYNVTPNFFISAEIDEDLNTFEGDEDNVIPKLHYEEDEPALHLNMQFKNRLFDRDTLWVSHYDVNFLFILALYARGDEYAKTKFGEKAKDEFRKAIVTSLSQKYFFRILKPLNGNLENAVEHTFKKLIGKIYRPHKNADFVILALEHNNPENNQLLNDIGAFFDSTEEYHLDVPNE